MRTVDMENGEAVRVWGRVRVDTLIWLGFALVLFALSAWMTAVIVKVERTPQQRGIAVTFVGLAKPERLPNVGFTVQDKGLGLSITGIARSISTVRLGTFPAAAEGAVSCEAGNRTIAASWATATDDEKAMTAHVGAQPTPQTYVIQLGALQARLPQPSAKSVQQALDAQEDQAAALQGGKSVHHDMTAAQEAAADREGAALQQSFDETDRLTCVLPIDVAHDTYTSRSFEVAMSEGLPDPAVIPPDSKLQSTFPNRVSLDDGDAQEIHVTNRGTGETLLASSITGPFAGYDATDLHHAVTVRFAWESVTATSSRDIYITVIGTLIALGAAALIEACRPYIEQLVRGKQKTL
jgi:hypothetical protein